MKAEVIVERFENGISLKWRDCDGKVDSSSRVALRGKEAELIGDEVFGDIRQVMEDARTEKVRATITYEAIA